MPSAMGCVGMCIYLPYVHTHADMHTMVFLSSRISWCYYLIVLYCKYSYSFLLFSWPGLGRGMAVSGQQFHSYLCCFFTSVAFSSLNCISVSRVVWCYIQEKDAHTYKSGSCPTACDPKAGVTLLHTFSDACWVLWSESHLWSANGKHKTWKCIWNPIPIPAVRAKTNSGKFRSSSRENQSVLWHSSSEQNERGMLHQMSPCIQWPSYLDDPLSLTSQWKETWGLYPCPSVGRHSKHLYLGIPSWQYALWCPRRYFAPSWC